MDTFNPDAATPEVMKAVQQYMNARVYGGVEGGVPAAENAFTSALRQLGCSEQYIESAVLRVRTDSDVIWRKKEGLDS